MLTHINNTGLVGVYSDRVLDTERSYLLNVFSVVPCLLFNYLDFIAYGALDDYGALAN